MKRSAPAPGDKNRCVWDDAKDSARLLGIIAVMSLPMIRARRHTLSILHTLGEETMSRRYFEDLTYGIYAISVVVAFVITYAVAALVPRSWVRRLALERRTCCG